MIRCAVRDSEIIVENDAVWGQWKVEEDDRKYETVIEVTKETTLECMRAMGQDKTLVLSFASAKRPGGGYLGGAQAQEESLARSSALVPCLERLRGPFYEYHNGNKGPTGCLYSHRMIWSPRVPFWRNDVGKALPVVCANVLTVAAVNAGVVESRLDKRNGPLLIASTMHRRCRRILLFALRRECEQLVLGAFGCGVFKNKPVDVAFIFRTLLLGEFRGCFRLVRFALSAAAPANWAAFERVLLRRDLAGVSPCLADGSFETYVPEGVKEERERDRQNARRAKEARGEKFWNAMAEGDE